MILRPCDNCGAPIMAGQECRCWNYEEEARGVQYERMAMHDRAIKRTKLQQWGKEDIIDYYEISNGFVYNNTYYYSFASIIYDRKTTVLLRLDEYEGDNDFLNSIKRYFNTYRDLTPKQVNRAALEMGLSI